MELTRIENNTFGIAIGKTLAEKLGASVGSKIRLLAAPKDLTNIPTLRQYVITGIFETGFYEFDASLIYVSLAAAQRDLQWGDLATGIQVRLVNAYEADRVSVELRETLAATYSDLFPTSWMYAQGNLYAWIWLQKWASFVVLSLIVIVAGFNIISILTMSVNERRREIGILKAMGAAPKKHRPNFFSRRTDNRRERRVIRQHIGRGPVLDTKSLCTHIALRRCLFHQRPPRNHKHPGLRHDLCPGIITMPRICPLARKTSGNSGPRRSDQI